MKKLSLTFIYIEGTLYASFWFCQEIFEKNFFLQRYKVTTA